MVERPNWHEMFNILGLMLFLFIVKVITKAVYYSIIIGLVVVGLMVTIWFFKLIFRFLKFLKNIGWKNRIYIAIAIIISLIEYQLYVHFFS